MTAWLLVPFAALMMVGIPISLCLLFASFIFTAAWGRVPVSILPKSMFGGVDSFYLLAIPFFILAGNLMNRTGITNRLIRFSDLIVGKIAGGLAQVNIFASIIFASLTGSGVADTTAIGTMLIPAMVKRGFTPEYSAAVTAASSVIGPIIPPSILMVIYSNVIGISLGDLFTAGFAPGIGIAVAMGVIAYYYAKKHNHPIREESISFREALSLTWNALLALLMPLIIIGGILGGIFTPTEAAAVSVLYALIIGFIVFRSLTWKSLFESLLESGRQSGVIMFIIACAAPFGWALTISRIPSIIAAAMLQLTTDKYLLLFIINIFLLFMGMIMETGANCIILAPILAPLAINAGVEPLHFAIVMVVNLNIGMSTPPLGVCLFIAASIAKIKFEALVRAISPFLAAEIVVLFILTYSETIALFVPRMLGYKG
ncbi:MAG: TRAP transporter large permease [Planctomycetes bacterium]|nr:TRAP transporter large permease [Planctomycetota bacterium]